MGIAILSLVVVYVPAIALALLIKSRLPKNMRQFLIKMGPAFLVAGICTYFGAKYYDISVIGRSGHLDGQDAVNFGVLSVCAGSIMTALHYTFLRLFPKWMLRRGSKRG